MKAYALTLYAYRWSSLGRLTTGHSTNVGLAIDDENMRKIALKKCHEDFPESEGYEGHQIGILFLGDKILELNGKQYKLQIVEV